MENVIKNIEKIRKDKDYSHEYMAFQIGISQAAYSKLINNRTKLTVERLYQIAEILEVKVTQLLDIESQINFTQNNKDNSVGYLQKEYNLYQENRSQYEKIIELYEARLKEKDFAIDLLKKSLK